MRFQNFPNDPEAETAKSKTSHKFKSIKAKCLEVKTGYRAPLAKTTWMKRTIENHKGRTMYKKDRIFTRNEKQRTKEKHDPSLKARDSEGFEQKKTSSERKTTNTHNWRNTIWYCEIQIQRGDNQENINRGKNRAGFEWVCMREDNMERETQHLKVMRIVSEISRSINKRESLTTRW